MSKTDNKDNKEDKYSPETSPPEKSPPETSPPVTPVTPLSDTSHNDIVTEKQDTENTSDIICRICWETDKEENLIQPCKCKGTMKWVHEKCLQKWLEVSGHQKCQECKYKYRTVKKFKYNWHKYLDNNYTIHAVSIITIFSVIYLFARLFRWLSIRAMKRRNIHLLYRIPSTLSFRFLTEGMKCCFFLSLMVLPWLDSIGVINLNQIQSDLLVNDSFVPDVYSIFYQVVFMSFKQIRDKHLDYKFIISSVEN